MSRPNWRVSVALIMIMLMVFLGYYFRHLIDVQDIQHGFESLGMLGPFVFTLMYALATVFCLPGAILTLVGGAVFGPWIGFLVNWIGANLGALGAFLLARNLLGHWVENHVSHTHVQWVLDEVSSGKWRTVAVIRAMPVIPFNIINYILGITTLRVDHYITATALVIMPFTFIYTYLGHAGMMALTEGRYNFIHYGGIALSLMVFLLIWPKVARSWGKRHLAHTMRDDAS